MTERNLKLLKTAIFIAALIPFVTLLYRGWQNQLGANPVETITDVTGIWTLRFLAITLAITPLRELTGMVVLIRFRRMLGLFTFFYGLLHFLNYTWLDQFFDWPFILQDIAKHPYIILGLMTFMILLVLAITSPRAMVRKLGKRWKKLHRLVYIAAFLGSFHYLWLVKSDIREPLSYLAIFVVLMILRLPSVKQKTPQVLGLFRSAKT
jgi:sulfoxide reductase heme-binding subunit YedZ